jgi:hypothetical protein
MTYNTVDYGSCTKQPLERMIHVLIEQLTSLQVRIEHLEETAPAPTPRMESATGAPSNNPTRIDEMPESAIGAALAPRFDKGDRVRIKNKMKKPATWSNNVAWKEDEAKTGTVTHIYKGQVHFLTDNGVKTWRAVNNLARIDDELYS